MRGRLLLDTHAGSARVLHAWLRHSAATKEFVAERAEQEALRQEVGEAEALLTQARTERKLAARELQKRLEAATVVSKDAEAVCGLLRRSLWPRRVLTARLLV